MMQKLLGRLTCGDSCNLSLRPECPASMMFQKSETHHPILHVWLIGPATRYLLLRRFSAFAAPKVGDIDKVWGRVLI